MYLFILLRFNSRTKIEKKKTAGGMNQPHFIFSAFATWFNISKLPSISCKLQSFFFLQQWNNNNSLRS